MNEIAVLVAYIRTLNFVGASWPAEGFFGFVDDFRCTKNRSRSRFWFSLVEKLLAAYCISIPKLLKDLWFLLRSSQRLNTNFFPFFISRGQHIGITHGWRLRRWRACCKWNWWLGALWYRASKLSCIEYGLWTSWLAQLQLRWTVKQGARWRKWPILTAIHVLPWICYSRKPSIQVITKGKKSPLWACEVSIWFNRGANKLHDSMV